MTFKKIFQYLALLLITWFPVNWLAMFVLDVLEKKHILYNSGGAALFYFFIIKFLSLGFFFFGFSFIEKTRPYLWVFILISFCILVKWIGLGFFILAGPTTNIFPLSIALRGIAKALTITDIGEGLPIYLLISFLGVFVGVKIQKRKTNNRF